MRIARCKKKGFTIAYTSKEELARIQFAYDGKEIRPPSFDPPDPSRLRGMAEEISSVAVRTEIEWNNVRLPARTLILEDLPEERALTTAERWERGGTFVYELARFEGLGEVDARLKQADYLKGLGLSGPSLRQVFLTLVSGYYDPQQWDNAETLAFGAATGFKSQAWRALWVFMREGRYSVANDWRLTYLGLKPPSVFQRIKQRVKKIGTVLFIG